MKTCSWSKLQTSDRGIWYWYQIPDQSGSWEEFLGDIAWMTDKADLVVIELDGEESRETPWEKTKELRWRGLSSEIGIKK